MPRSPRLEFEGAFYHVMCRGDRREAVFVDAEDHELFLKTLGETCGRAGFRVHAYVLMGNHYHLLLETPEANLVTGMRWLQTTYTARHNARHRLCGHLFQGRYKALVVDPDESSYAVAVADYIHLNPVRARMAHTEPELREYAWSSYRWYAGERRAPAWLERSVMGWELAGPAGRIVQARRIREHTRGRIGEELQGRGLDWQEVRLGWCMGGEGFRERMLELLERGLQGKQKESFERRGAVARHDAVAGERLVRLGIAHLGLKERDLVEMKKNDARKQALGWWIRRRTTVGDAWICERVALGHRSNLTRAVRRFENGADAEARRWRKRMTQCTD